MAPAGDWHALVCEALLDHVDRGDSRQALQRLLGSLAARLRAPCVLVAQRPDGATRWQMRAEPGLAAQAAPPPAQDPALQLPLSRLGRPLGLLQLHAAHAGVDAASLQPVCEAMAALLLAERDPATAPPQPGYIQTIRGALEGGGTFVWEWDIDTDHLSDIDEGLQQLGYAALEVGRTQADWNTLIHPGDVDANHDAYLRHARGEVDSYEHAYRIRARDGGWRWYQERGRIVERHADGRPRRMVGTQTDITEQRAREDDASQAAARLDRARQDKATAEAANRAKTEFLSRMSHELRTPLNAVLGFAQLLELERADRLSENQRRRVTLIREAGEHLLRMIGDMLDLTRIESGRLQVRIDVVPLRALAQEAIDMLRPQAEAARLSVTLQLDDTELAARADPTRLRQVLLNLLSNAVKYNRPGGRVELRVGAQAPADGTVQIVVQDSGVGIAEGDLPHLFEPFNRLAQARSGIEGSGIGLSVTRALLALMHGRIDVASEAGVGTRVQVTLPRA